MRSSLKRSALALTALAAVSAGTAGPAPCRAAVETEKTTTTVHAGNPEGKGEAKGADDNPLHFDMMEAVWIILIFLVLLVVLYKTAWKNVLAGLKAREQRIRQDIADAEASRSKAEAMLKQYNEQVAGGEQRVRDMLSQATVEAERLSTQIRMQAQKDSEEIKARNLKDIEESKNQALREIYEQTAVLATSVAEKILRRNLNADDQRDLVNQSLEQLQAVGKN